MLHRHFSKTFIAALCSLSLCATATAMAGPDINTTQTYNLAGQNLDLALRQIAEQDNLQIIFSSADVNDVRAQALHGEYSPLQAISELLKGTGLTYSFNGSDTVVVRKAGADNAGAAAEQGADESGARTRPARIDEIIVTAQKREQSVYDVPISILAFDAEDIKAQKITDWNDLALAVPGLLTSSNGGGQYVFMRGLGNISGSSSMVGIYVDEISVSSGRPVQQLDTRLYDVERVEVLRGPQGTLYGQGAMAGTFRIITKDPQLENFGFKADFDASFTQDGAPSQQAEVVVNIPLIADKFGLRVSGIFEHSGGWVDQPIGDQEDINGQDVTNVRAKALWRPADALTVEATAIVHRNDFGPQGEQTDGNHTPAFDVFTLTEWDDQYELYNLTWSYDFDAVNLLSTSSYVNADKSAQDWGATSGAPLFHVMLDPWIQGSNIFTQEVRLSSTDTGRWQWTFGGLYEEWKEDGSFTIFLGAPGPLPTSPFFSEVDNYTSESWAVFGDASFALTPRLEIGAGLRYFEDKRSQATRLNDVETGTFEGDFDAVSPRFYVNYDVTGDVKAYGSVAKGFRSGGGASFGLTSGTPKSFGPETVWTYELGAKGGVFDGRLVGDIAIFYTDYSDVVVRLIPPPPDNLFGFSEINAGDAEVLGSEVSFTWQAEEHLRLGFIGTWLDSEFTSVAGTQAPKLPGDSLDFVKKYQFALWAEYDFILANRPGSVRVDYNEQGPAEFSNRFSGSFVESDVINMLNLRATWNWSDELYLGVFGQNLLNDRGVAEPIGSSGPFAKLQHPRPRTLGVEFGVNF